MKRIGVLTAGGDTPALNATIYGAVLRASQLRMEIFGFIKGFSSLLNPRLPHVHLNPLLQVIPELDATLGGTGLGASRDYLPGDDPALVDQILVRLDQLGVEGLICIGGDGTLNGLQPLTERLPVVLAPKTIDNDLGLNYPSEPDEWYRDDDDAYYRKESKLVFNQEHMVNYVTPGYATAVFDSAMGVERVRTTAESHRRIAIIEVMGRHSGYIALGSAYGRPDIVLVPECPVHIDPLVERIKDLYDLQKNVVIVCGEGIVDEEGNELGAAQQTTDPAGNIVLSGAAESLRAMLIERIGDDYFSSRRRGESASAAIFVRKVGHTQRGGRPVLFDRFYASQLGGKAVDMLQEGQNNAVAVLQWGREQGFYVDSVAGHRLRDRWGQIHARPMHASFYDEERMKPSQVGIDYLLPIFTSAIGHDDVEHIRHTLFDSGNLMLPYHSINTDVNKRIRYLQ
ncbi:MAG: 6-phosphofructokinase [Gemmatimonadetes bacterium]|jgi:6-phosphofructokinase|nr:6-phosphofructokinase [Gemmatimonadota bacterium]MDE0963824.1 6-phosphofructokinase [Candidatus Latescibacterota bacterium]MBT5330105.1 6-phosphofructokinase [Gemmatimonadota bacterium]MBT5450653.1 6-phosphofructokinase [Gemmatimonadota bacterium]MBT5801821.1 6-phosphofructokinase [Gemmatimonadota bacterium]